MAKRTERVSLSPALRHPKLRHCARRDVGTLSGPMVASMRNAFRLMRGPIRAGAIGTDNEPHQWLGSFAQRLKFYGFRHLSQFSLAFKNRFGMRSRDYRAAFGPAHH